MIGKMKADGGMKPEQILSKQQLDALDKEGYIIIRKIDHTRWWYERQLLKAKQDG